MFQGPSLIPALDVVESVALPLVLAGRTPRDAAVEARAALAALGAVPLAAVVNGQVGPFSSR